MAVPRAQRHDDARAAALRHLVGAIGISVAGSLMFLLVPMLVEGLRSHAPWLPEQQVGFIGSADAAGMFLGTILALATAKRRDRRWLAGLGLALLCLANLGALFAQAYPSLLAARLLAGLGGGLAVGVGHAAFAGTAVPDRSIAIYLIAQTCIGSVVIGLLSRAMPAFGLDALFLATAGIGLLGCALATWVRPYPVDHTGDARAPQTAPRLPVPRAMVVGMLCLGSNVLLGAAFTAAWANVDSLGKAYGLDPDGVATAMSVSLLSATAGSIIVALLGDRFGRAWPFLVITASTVLGIVLLGRPVGMVAYGTALVMMMFGTSSTSYIFGALSTADASGRLSIAHALSLKAGFALGPALGSFMIVHGGFAMALLFAGAGTCVVILLGLAAFGLLPRAESLRPARGGAGVAADEGSR